MSVVTPGKESLCAICDKSDGLGLATCSGCGITVHIDEYLADWGAKEVPKDWYCLLCKDNGCQRPENPPRCVLCLKATFKFPYLIVKRNEYFGANNKDKWAHFHCVSFLNETWQDEDSKAVIDLDLKNELPAKEAYWHIRKERVNLRCSICFNTGWKNSVNNQKKFRSACVQCSDDTCPEAFHVTCALLKRFQYHTIVDVANTSFQIFCPQHSKKFNNKKKIGSKKRKRLIDTNTNDGGGGGCSSSSSSSSAITAVTTISSVSDNGDAHTVHKPTEISRKTSSDAAKEKGTINQEHDKKDSTLQKNSIDSLFVNTRQAVSSDPKVKYTSKEIAEATKEIMSLKHPTNHSFHQDDMEKMVPLLFKITNVNAQIDVITTLRNSSFQCVQAFFKQPYPHEENFIVNHKKILDNFRPSQYVCNN
jgi:hypothetical protein